MAEPTNMKAVTPTKAEQRAAPINAQATIIKYCTIAIGKNHSHVRTSLLPVKFERNRLQAATDNAIIRFYFFARADRLFSAS